MFTGFSGYDLGILRGGYFLPIELSQFTYINTIDVFDLSVTILSAIYCMNYVYNVSLSMPSISLLFFAGWGYLFIHLSSCLTNISSLYFKIVFMINAYLHT